MGKVEGTGQIGPSISGRERCASHPPSRPQHSPQCLQLPRWRHSHRRPPALKRSGLAAYNECCPTTADRSWPVAPSPARGSSKADGPSETSATATSSRPPSSSAPSTSAETGASGTFPTPRRGGSTPASPATSRRPAAATRPGVTTKLASPSPHAPPTQVEPASSPGTTYPAAESASRPA